MYRIFLQYNFKFTFLKRLLFLFYNVFIHTFQEFILENYLLTSEIMEAENVIYFQKNQASFFELSQGKNHHVPYFFM